MNAELLFPCDSCNKLLCASEECGNLTASEIKCLQLKNKRKLIFLCPDCETGFWRVPMIMEELTTLKNRFNELENLMKDNANAVSIPRPPIQTDNNVTEEIITELFERQKRESNIMVMNVKESQAAAPHVRKQEDIDTIKSLFQRVEVDLDRINVFRVGQVALNKNRLIKVVMNGRQDAVTIFKNKNLLPPGIKIFSDQTKSQREYYLSVKNKLNEQIASGDTSKTIKYVNNVPTIINKSSLRSKN